MPALLWGVAFANIVAGVPIDADKEFTGNLFTLLNPFGLLGGLVTLTLFATHGAHVRGAQDRRRDPAPRPRPGRADRRVAAVLAVVFLLVDAGSRPVRRSPRCVFAVAALALVGGPRRGRAPAARAGPSSAPS